MRCKIPFRSINDNRYQITLKYISDEVLSNLFVSSSTFLSISISPTLSLTYSVTHSHTHLLTQSLTHTLTRSLTHTHNTHTHSLFHSQTQSITQSLITHPITHNRSCRNMFEINKLVVNQIIAVNGRNVLLVTTILFHNLWLYIREWYWYYNPKSRFSNIERMVWSKKVNVWIISTQNVLKYNSKGIRQVVKLKKWRLYRHICS